MGFDINIISTGSQGNCVVIDGSIMCDAGISRKKIEDSGFDMHNLDVLMVSHKHHDHTNLATIRWAIEHSVETHLPNSIIEMLRDEGRINIDQYLGRTVYVHEDKDEYTLQLKKSPYTKEMHLKLYPQRHHDIINYAFVMEKEVDGKKQRMLYSTDLDTIGPTEVGPGLTALGMFNTIVLEGNYDEVWLRDFIESSIGAVDDSIDTLTMTNSELDKWLRANYRQLPRDISAGLFRAVQNMRHLSKQQARLYVRNHLLPGGDYYEVHRSHMFYERPSTW